MGLLSRPERYLWALGQLPRLKAKLAVLVFRGQCQPLLQDAQAALHTIQQACQQVQFHMLVVDPQNLEAVVYILL